MVDGDAAGHAAPERLEELVGSVRIAVERELLRELHRLAAKHLDELVVASAASAFERVVYEALDRVVVAHGHVDRMDVWRVPDAVRDERNRGASVDRRLRRPPSGKPSANYKNVFHDGISLKDAGIVAKFPRLKPYYHE